MGRLKTRSCSKLLAVQKRVRQPTDGWRNHTYFLPGDSRWWDSSLAILSLAPDVVLADAHPPVRFSLLPRRECFAVLFSLFLFYLHVAAPALCQSWQSRLKWARPFPRIPANHGAPLGLLRLSWPMGTPWRITDRLRVSVTDGRAISFKI